MKEHNRIDVAKNKIIQILTWGLFICVFLVLCYYLRTRLLTIIDSDMSSELILARMLKDERRILSPNWYYSTELRVLYVTQVFELLFFFTDDWFTVRVYGEIIMHIILMLSLWCMMSVLGKRKLFPVMGIFLCLPFSAVYMGYELDSTAYIPYMITSFLGISITVSFVRHNARKAGLLLITAAVVNAFVSSLIGLRPVVMFFLPAFAGALIPVLTQIIQNRRINYGSVYLKYLIISSAGLAGSLGGCAVNSLILVRRYKVYDWNNRRFVGFSLESVIRSVNGMINNLGYRSSHMSLSVILANGYALLIFTGCVLVVFLTLRSIKNRPDELVYLSAFFVTATVIFVLLYSLTDMVYYDLYSLPIIVFVFPIVFIGIDEYLKNHVVKYAVSAVLITLVMCTSVRTYVDFLHTDKNPERRQIAAFLTEHEYQNGYATFWNANVLTELSGGAIDVYEWEDAKMLPYVTNVNSIHEWLQKTSHTTQTPGGRVFQLFERSELYFCNWKDSLSDDRIIYETENYVVYAYPSYEEMKAECIIPDSD